MVLDLFERKAALSRARSASSLLSETGEDIDVAALMDADRSVDLFRKLSTCTGYTEKQEAIADFNRTDSAEVPKLAAEGTALAEHVAQSRAAYEVMGRHICFV